MSARRRQLRAFTLIEVLATMMLLAIVLPVAMRGVQLALRAASKARHIAEASMLAETKLNDLVISGLWQASSGTSGDFGQDHQGYQWTCQTMPRDYNMSEVSLMVTWQDGGLPQSMQVATMAYQSDTGGMP